MDDLYDINFESNGEFCKIHLYFNNIRNLCIVKDLVDSFAVDSNKNSIFKTKKRKFLNLLLNKTAQHTGRVKTMGFIFKP
jgi:hypothetical protein